MPACHNQGGLRQALDTSGPVSGYLNPLKEKLQWNRGLAPPGFDPTSESLWMAPLTQPQFGIDMGVPTLVKILATRRPFGLSRG